MNNLSRFLRLSRNELSKGLLYGKDGNLSEGLAPLGAYYTAHARAGFSTTGQNISPKGKSDGFFVSYTVYKGKAALSIAPVLPTFTKLDSGFHVINRMGSVLLKFVPAIGERKYNWEKKQIFGLNPTEIGSLISMGSTDSCEFFHDPSMKSSNAGQVRKSLSIKPHTTGGGYMISLTVVNNLLKTRDNISVPFTTAEFAVMKTSCNYALPHILGWDQLTMNSGLSLAYSSPKVDRQLLETEWDK